MTQHQPGLAGELQSESRMSHEEKRVVFGASLGTVFEWYDFNCFAVLAPVIAHEFFAKVDPTTGLIFALLAFSAGFIVRPLGALVFGRLGDIVGRKYTFLATMLIMGLSTFSVGLLPGYDAIGLAAPIMLLAFRLVQGLAIGGEYGGAVVYVAEHAPGARRGEYTSWVQTTGMLGFLLSLLVTLGLRTVLGETAFAAWGWRIPFLASSFLLAISMWIRLAMAESPVFARMKAEGAMSRRPLLEAFGQWRHLKVVLLAMFGLVSGFAVVVYTAQIYALLFLTQTLKVNASTANQLIVLALVLGAPFFVVFGKLSDRLGRKKIILAGVLFGAVSYMPIFKALTHYANPALEEAMAHSPVVVVADPNDCHFQINITGTRRFTSSCDILKAKLVATGVSYKTVDAPAGTVASVKLGDTSLTSFNASRLTKSQEEEKGVALSEAISSAIHAAGYPVKADSTRVNRPVLLALIFIMVIFSTMATGPAAAMLVELFPTSIRYSALSLPYHLGSGWIGGLMPTTAFSLVAYKGDIYFGLWYPILIALVTVVIGGIFLRETRGTDISQ